MGSELTDNILRLRTPTASDIAAAVEAVRASLPELMAWTSWTHPDYGRGDVEQFLRKVEVERFEDRAYDFYIHDRERSRILGGVGLYHVDRATASASLGYWVRSDAAGQGIATAAARLVVPFGFRELELTRIEILAAVDNRGSQRVAEKIGATREGVLRNRLRLHGRAIDAVSYSLIPTDLAS